MPIEGYEDYRRREFCNDIRCPVQVELNKQKEGSEEYERIRKTCGESCRFTTWDFHHWLIDKGYLIVRPKEGG
ncbi:MAG: hypothetical protein GTN39_02940 [Candidatus Aenigmarchaeota archaeon]|nr:hypothetical protein [Candidatus Aenigmarchaeota archaeon]